MPNANNAKHVQTLVGMNHCVEIARRDAAYLCLMEFTTGNRESLQDSVATTRMDCYERCAYLLREAMTATKNATLCYDRNGIRDRPAVHILKLLNAFMAAVNSLATHVNMVDETADVLSEPLGAEAYALLVNTCREFGATENEARESFLRILNVGRILLEASTTTHSADFSDDEKRRYNLAHDEYVRLYSDGNRELSKRLKPSAGR